MSRRLGNFIGGLKSDVAFLVFIVFISISAIAFFAFQTIVDETVERIGISFAHEKVLYAKARSLQPLQRELALATKMARSPSIIAWAKDEKNQYLKGNAIDEMESFRNMFRDKSYFFVIGKSGHFYFNDKDGSYTGKEYRYTISPNNPRDEWYYITTLKDKECQLNVDTDRELGITKVWINCRVMEDQKVLGVIGTGIDLTEFIQTVIETKQVGVDTIFIDKSGAIQASRDPKLIDFHSLTKQIKDRKTVFQLIDDSAKQKELRLILKSLQEGNEELRTMFLKIGGKRYLAGVAFLKDMGWFNITLMDTEAMIDREYFNYFAGLMALALSLTLVLVTLLLNRFVLNRIYKLEDSVQEVSKGNYDTFTMDERDDEIGRLSASFKKMAERIGKQTKNLEQQVEARTKEFEVAKENAEATTKLKDKFVSIVAHDLKGPITSMQWLMNLTLESSNMDDAHKHAKRSLDTSNSLLEMIQELLDVSRLQSGLISLKKDLFNLYTTTLEKILELKPLAENKGIEIINNIPKETVFFADEMLIGQALLNLISNAIKFTDKDGIITISMEKEKVITVHDTGRGIPAKIKPNIFSHELNTTSLGTEGEKGTGFGLPLCHDIIKAHGGDLRFETSENGTVFYMELPVE